MRIALLGPTYPFRGGIAHHTTMLDDALRKRGHTVLFLSFKRQYPSWLFPGQSDRDPSGAPLRAGEVEYRLDSLNPFSWLSTFARMRHFGPDVVILPWWTTFWTPAWFVLGMLIRLSLQRPLVFVCHNVLPHEAKFWDSWMTRAVLHWGTGFVVQSREEQDKLRRLLPGAPIAVVPHPVYDMFSSSPISKAEARAKLDIPTRASVLLFFGIVREYKGLMDLLEAMPEAKRHTTDLLLVVAGEFWDSKARYVQKMQSLGIEDCVRLVDRYIPNEEVPHYFRAADLVVAPYRRATGSGVVQMAIGFGSPLLTTLDWMFEGYQVPPHCLLVPPNDSQAIAQAISTSVLQPGASWEGRGTEELRAAFSWERLVTAIEGLVSGSLR